MSIFYPSATVVRRLGSTLGPLPGRAGDFPPPEGVEFDIQQAVVGVNTGGTDDFTNTGFGTPKAVLNALQYTTVSGTIEAHAAGGVGVSDGTRHGERAFWSKDGVGTSVAKHHFDDTHAIEILTEAASEGASEATMSNITDGCRYTWVSSAAPSDLVLNNLMFGGSNVSGHVGSKAVLINEDETDSVTNVGFKPDVVFLLSSAADFDTATVAHSRMSFGFSDANLNQGSLFCRDRHNRTTTEVHTNISNSYISNEDGSGTVRNLELTSLDSDGFTVTARSSAWSSDLIWLALKLARPADARVGTLDLPTSTGIHTVSGIGFKPRLVVQLSSLLTAYDSRTAQDCLFGLSLIMESAQFSGGATSEEGVVTTSTHSGMDNKAIYFPDPASAISQWEGDFDSFENNKYAINYTKVPGGTAPKGLFLAFR